MTPRRFANALALLMVCAYVGLPGTVRAQPGSDAIVIGERIKIESEILLETRPLLIAKPRGYERGTEHYPVLYLLDGDSHFHHTTGIVSFLADSGRIPPMLGACPRNHCRGHMLYFKSVRPQDIALEGGVFRILGHTPNGCDCQYQPQP